MPNSIKLSNKLKITHPKTLPHKKYLSISFVYFLSLVYSLGVFKLEAIMGYVGETERHRKIQWDILRDIYRRAFTFSSKTLLICFLHPCGREDIAELPIVTTDNRQKYIAKRMKLEGLI